MRRILAIVAACIVLAGCTQVVEPPAIPAPNLHVYNSAWDKVAEATVRGLSCEISRGVDDPLEIAAFVDEYNAAHTDDQLVIVEGGEVPITEAPDAPAWIVNSTTLEIYWSDVVSRADLVARRDVWRRTVEVMADPKTGILTACTLYVDRIPPEPPVVVEPPPRLWVALIWVTGHQVFCSEKCATEADAIYRYRILDAQRDLNEMGLGDMGEGDWSTYIGTEEFRW